MREHICTLCIENSVWCDYSCGYFWPLPVMLATFRIHYFNNKIFISTSISFLYSLVGMLSYTHHSICHHVSLKLLTAQLHIESVLYINYIKYKTLKQGTKPRVNFTTRYIKMNFWSYQRHP